MLDYAYRTVPSQCDVFIYYRGATGAGLVAGAVELLPQLLVPVTGVAATVVPPCVGVRDQTGRPP